MGDPQNAQQLRHTYASEEEVLETAPEWQRIPRCVAYFSIIQAVSGPDIFPAPRATA